MANALTALNKEYWRAEMQQIFFKESVAYDIAALELRAMLADGDTINHPYLTHPHAVTYTKGSAITNKDVFSANEQLSVDTTKVAPIYVDSIDRVQNAWDVQKTHAQRSQRALNTILDQKVVNLGVNAATSSIDAGNVGGSAGSNIVLSVSNLDQIHTALNMKLDTLDIPAANRFVLYGPRMKETYHRYLGGKETAMGDIIGANGKISNRFGLELYYSNNNYYTATWTPANTVSATQTVTINGAVLEFVATPDSGEASTAYIGVDIGGSVSVDLTNIVAAINDTGTAGTTYGITDALNWKARFKLLKAGVVATKVSTTHMTIVAYGDIVVATSDSDDPWSSQTSYVLCGLKKAVSMATQRNNEVDVKDVYNKLGNNIFVWNLFGGKVFQDMADALVYAKVDASNWT